MICVTVLAKNSNIDGKKLKKIAFAAAA